MQYQDLHQLIQNSQSSRSFFLSLPAELQCRLHEYNAYVRTAAELHSMAGSLQSAARQDLLGGWSHIHKK
ncbi:MAG: hypothetical protein ACOX6U_08825 [Oscillospiraceae bacterium]|jgi:hypothetical protein